ncbi:sodium:solute symporter family protein [Psychroflexus montanilacus]|uniref:sodium:solute symporter family protein n=1 Tax=Psychroflexus montanilacus TaxID=2873598 RepID=UPI001CCC9CE8|nr:sodium:solute symporter family protein [Psychroflexus montanilacus]MBZ9650400.1 Na+:solute symporter [Psychroflexus montanilacus]
MLLSPIDWIIIISFFALSLGIGIYVSKSSGKSAKNFFLSGRNMSWWLLGISMVATTFAADTPGLVAGIVRNDGVYGNWVWWSFLLTGMLTVFFYSKLWRKSEISTDLEFYELRYSGKSAAFLRGFRAIYLGVFFNIVIMATVCLAAIKIGHVMFNFSAVESLVISCSVTVLYSMLGGLKGVILTDFIQFAIAIAGSIWATVYIVEMPEIGGLQELLSIPEVQIKSSIFPDFTNPEVYVPILVVPLAVQWWSVWYPGAEPGGGGYIVQRMLAAKNTKHATLATLLFTVVHYAVRPWPWIIIGLASIVLFPDLQSLASAFPDLNEEFIKNDLAYAAMLSYLPAGLLGLVVTSLIAAFMSTISTHLNWGSSYVVNDFYVRFIKPNASEGNKVMIGRLSTFLMMIFSALLALVLEEAKEAFDLLLQIGAGTGLLFILRWFWYRINPYSEIAAMLSSFVIAVIFFIGKTNNYWQIDSYVELVIGVLITTCIWVGITLITKPSSKETLYSFENKVFDNGKFEGFKFKIVGFVAGVAGVYSSLFATGYLIYNNILLFSISSFISLLAIGILIRYWKRIIN